MTGLRLITYLSPGLPMAFFQTIADALGPDTVLSADPRASGPVPDEMDPFSDGRADIGFMCAPAFLAMRRGVANPAVRLLGFAPVFDDPRANGRPLYHADVVVRADDGAQTFGDLRGRRVGYNDAVSLSGRLALLIHLAKLGEDLSYFSETVGTGSHDASLVALHEGLIDTATIDATTLRLRQNTGDPLATHVRVIQGLGPHPIQPIVIRADLAEDQVVHVHRALNALTQSAGGRAALAPFGCIGFAPVTDASYQELDRLLADLDVDYGVRI
jgi:phosphonate transport system substrate-binding protein